MCWTLSVNVPITAVNLSNAFVVENSRLDSGSQIDNEEAFFSVNFTNSTNVLLERGSSGAGATVFIQVGELGGAITQSGTTTMTDGGTSVAQAISSVNISQSFLLFRNHQVGGDPNQDTNVIRGNFTSNSEITFYRGGTNTPDEHTIKWFVVSMPNIKVQHVTGFMGSISNLSVDIEEVNLSQSFVITTYDSTQSTTSWSGSYNLAFLNSSTTILTKKAFPLGDSIFNYQVVEFLTDAPPPAPPDVPIVVITSPANDSTTNIEPIIIGGTVDLNSTCTLLTNITGGFVGVDSIITNDTFSLEHNHSLGSGMETLEYIVSCDNNLNMSFSGNSTTLTVNYDNGTAPTISTINHHHKQIHLLFYQDVV